MSEEIAEPGPLVRSSLLTLYLGMMAGAGLLHGLLEMVPRPRTENLHGWREWFYDVCVRVEEFTIVLLVHLRGGTKAVGRIHCPRCGARPEVFFEPDGRRFSIKGGCWHMGGSFPLLGTPPGWWRRHVRHEDGWGD